MSARLSALGKILIALILLEVLRVPALLALRCKKENAQTLTSVEFLLSLVLRTQFVVTILEAIRVTVKKDSQKQPMESARTLMSAIMSASTTAGTQSAVTSAFVQ